MGILELRHAFNLCDPLACLESGGTYTRPRPVPLVRLPFHSWSNRSTSLSCVEWNTIRRPYCQQCPQFRVDNFYRIAFLFSEPCFRTRSRFDRALERTSSHLSIFPWCCWRVEWPSCGCCHGMHSLDDPRLYLGVCLSMCTLRDDSIPKALKPSNGCPGEHSASKSLLAVLEVSAWK